MEQAGSVAENGSVFYVRVCNNSVKYLLRESREKLKKSDQDDNCAANKSLPNFSHSVVIKTTD
jgi:hypothetical protein